MKKEPIIRSPYAFDVNKMISMSKEEKMKLYTQRADTYVKPFTVIDVLRNVYNRDFFDDLSSYVDRFPCILKLMKKSSNDWFIDKYKIVGFRIIRPESIFGQPIEDFMVDILGEATVILSERDKAGHGRVNEYTAKKEVRLRYCFDLRPCELTCQFFGLLSEEKESLYSVFPSAFHLDKYLLPVLSTKKDYERMARYIIENDMPEFLDADDWICGIDWIRNMGIGVYFGEFPENGVMGEYFFGFGTGKVLDPETRECREELINPGTILLNMDALDTRGKMNSTSTHEGVHHRLAYYYFMLQRTHGGNISSYLCKRYDEREHEKDRTTSWTPVDIMELHANKLPAYILIQEKPGRAKARELMKSYGGTDRIQKMMRLVDDMAEFFKVTKTIAKSRLYEFGYREVSGISMYINGKYVPPYVSMLPRNQTYCVDEWEAIREYQRNPEFRELIDTGRYEYIEGHYCLRDYKYIWFDHLGHKHLTDYAREHMDECCLVFEIGYESVTPAISGSVIRKGSTRKVIRYISREGGSPVTRQGLEWRDKVRLAMEEHQAARKTFNQMTVDLMELKNMRVGDLAEKTGLSVDTIKNMRNNPAKAVKIEEIVAVCIALHLSRETIIEYINRAPSSFCETDEDNCYRYALMEWNDLSVAEVNRRLIEGGIRPLTDLVSGLDSDIFAVTG